MPTFSLTTNDGTATAIVISADDLPLMSHVTTLRDANYMAAQQFFDPEVCQCA